MKNPIIEIKNIKINKAFSEETICFTADIYVNGVKTGYAKNDGHGGCTHYNHYENKLELLEQAEAYAKTLPSKTHGTLTIESDLEGLIDEAIDNHLNAKERASFNKKMVKCMETNICIGVPNSGTYKTFGYGKTPLKMVCRLDKPQVQKLIDRLRSELKNGEVILNTNLEELGLV